MLLTRIHIVPFGNITIRFSRLQTPTSPLKFNILLNYFKWNLFVQWLSKIICFFYLFMFLEEGGGHKLYKLTEQVCTS